MRPTDGSAIYRPDLGETVIEAGQDTTGGFIGLEVLPPYTTPDDVGVFNVIPLEQLMKLENVDRKDRGAYNRSDWEYESGEYKCKEKGHEEPMDDNEFKRLERRRPGLADEISIMRAMGIVKRAQEARIAAKVMDSSRFNVEGVANAWDVPADGTPIADFNAAYKVYRAQCGMLPNAAIMSWNTRQNIVQCAEVIDRLLYTFPGIDLNRISDVQLAAILNIPRVLVGNAMYDAADKGQARSLTDIWSNDYCCLTRVSMSEDLAAPCIGRTFIWDEDSKEEPIVEVYREEQIKSDVYRVRHQVDERLIASIDEDGNTVSDIAAAVTLLIGSIKTA